ncbi:FMN-binding protein [Microbacterium sp.]|uniref:FMN-binding protein n=1 Tax=Microbacterium sp. TaxID=51671 RepID=UPI0028A0EBA3|nr:FMN-binding protein [Microbacterium sp.]
MKKIVYWLLATLSGLVLLFSYRTSTGADLSLVDTSASGASTTSGTSSSASSGASSSAGSSTSTGESTPTATADGATATPAQNASGLTDGTYTGDATGTRYGAVQVQITVSGGVITDVQVPQYPGGDRRNVAINARAVPILVSETLDAQSADISMVSGATFTSNGYLTSLQSAIDQAQR